MEWCDEQISKSNSKSHTHCPAANITYNCQACLSGTCCIEARQSTNPEEDNVDESAPGSSQFYQKMMDFYTESSYQESHDELYSEVREYVNDSDVYEPSDSEILHRLLFNSTSPKDEPLEVIWESSNEEEEQYYNSEEDFWAKEEKENLGENLCYNKANSLVWQIENCFLETAHLLDRQSVANCSSADVDPLKELPYNLNVKDPPSLPLESINLRGKFRITMDDEDHDYVNISECYSDYTDNWHLYNPDKSENICVPQPSRPASSIANDHLQIGDTYQNLSCINYTSKEDISSLYIDENSIEDLFTECFEYSSIEPNTTSEACLRNLQNLFHHLRVAKKHISSSTSDYYFIQKCRDHFNDLLYNEAITVLNSDTFCYIEKAIERAILRSKSRLADSSFSIRQTDQIGRRTDADVCQNGNWNGDYKTDHKNNPSYLHSEAMTYEDSLELYRDNKELQDSLLSILHSLHDIHDNFLKRRRTEIDSIQNSASLMFNKVISAVAPNSDGLHDYVNFPLEKFTREDGLTDSEAIQQITDISHELKYLWKTYNQSENRSLRRSKSVRNGHKLKYNSKLCHSLPNLTSLPHSQYAEFASSLNIDQQSPVDRLKNFVLQMKSENRRCYDITLTFLKKIMQKFEISHKCLTDEDPQRKLFYPEEPPIDYARAH